MNSPVKKTLLFLAEAALILVIIALIAANWIPVVVGAHPSATPSQRSMP